jgi:hypothetical protein
MCPFCAEFEPADVAVRVTFFGVAPWVHVWSRYTENAAAISDATDADVGEFDISGAPTVVVRLGDLTLVSGIQTVVFQVTTD